MSLESDLYAALSAICPRVFPDVAPSGTVSPWITWQQIGGQALSYLGREVPDLRNAFIQVSVWAPSRLEANTIAAQIETALTTSTAFTAKPVDAQYATYEDDTRLYGAAQRYSIWDSR
jgi:hypothetical protein